LETSVTAIPSLDAEGRRRLTAVVQYSVPVWIDRYQTTNNIVEIFAIIIKIRHTLYIVASHDRFRSSARLMNIKRWGRLI